MWSSGIVIAGYRVPSTGNRVICLNSYLQVGTDLIVLRKSEPPLITGVHSLQ